MKLDLKAYAFISTLFLSTSLSAAEIELVNQIKEDVPLASSIEDREILQSFLIQNAPRLGTETVKSIADMITQNQEQSLDLMENLGHITGDIRFMGSQPECTDARP